MTGETVVVYRKSKRAKKVFIEVFEEHADEILSSTKRKPLIPFEYEILDIGVGESFVELYKKKHNIK